MEKQILGEQGNMCSDCKKKKAVKLNMCEDCIRRDAKEIRDEKAAKSGKKRAAVKEERKR